jgi:hypothetical protein
LCKYDLTKVSFFYAGCDARLILSALVLMNVTIWGYQEVGHEKYQREVTIVKDLP